MKIRIWCATGRAKIEIPADGEVQTELTVDRAKLDIICDRNGISWGA